ncbi:3-oxo-5-alpha-steroid 4-dehydrogenase family protein [Trichomonas vaginalis G3]|uniref:3-oxo-5-alpha-steroid 4-dehydrogenase family protein n=1 Tax=Trichomonas vaginalis (strain ATCC PRA-98 / G3) TaxID=412133 RepID=A2DIQ2_TRIV3|nr:3-oxo-5-alpha-steroid 4-dehydrogenase protein [Trichomonas vaginalis G3]EAY19665.1 3-oxo-5-alpha-steroid 4-dehydrogenase family protein [Trichomonas vaginalis G3]KAI5521315.1 3-oxo-5-alpha-steroid 4-dehydrogenase protein [Trichomonas vaginalis G3]|eukprot:XP_001580651.1 3-oxo-5-alpha-steroid 4-dehydrogenase family protein [Trichomonas vaginalis G3]
MISFAPPYIPVFYEIARLLMKEWFFNIFAILSSALALFVFYTRAKKPLNYGKLYQEPAIKPKFWFLIPAWIAFFIINIFPLAIFVYFLLIFSQQEASIDPFNIPALLIVVYRVFRGLIYPFFKGNSRRWPSTVLGYYFGVNILISILQARTLMMEYWGFGGILIYALTGIWCISFLVNCYYDIHLATRKNKKKRGYSVVTLGLFKKVAAANYSFELIMTISWALLCNLSIGVLAILIWTLPNIVLRARHIQQWEKNHFTNVPLKKTPLIPGWTFQPKRGQFYGIFDFMI